MTGMNTLKERSKQAIDQSVMSRKESVACDSIGTKENTMRAFLKHYKFTFKLDVNGLGMSGLVLFADISKKERHQCA